RRDVLAQVAEQARAQANAVAIDAGNIQVSYAALAGRVATVAESLNDAGCKPGDLIATWVTDRAALVSVMLGVWSAGGAFVPLETHAPEERIRQQLGRLEPAFLIHDADDDVVPRRLVTDATNACRV